MTDTLVIVSGAGEQGPPGPPSLDVGAVVTGRGQIPVGDGSGDPTVIPAGVGTAGQFLRGGLDPAYDNVDIADVTGLQASLDAKAPLASPTFTGTVSATGDAALGDSDGDLTTVRRLRRRSVKPAVAATPAATYPGAGGDATPPIVSNSGSDGAGSVSVTLGNSPGSGNLVKVTFASAKPDANYVVILQPESTAARQRQNSISAKATDGFTISINSGGVQGDQVIFGYTVTEWQEG